MSVLSNIALSGATLALGFAAGGTALTIAAPPPAVFSAPERMAASVSGSQGDIEDASALARSWPAVFGTEVIPEPEPAPQPEPVAAPLPEPEPDLPPEPEIRYDYVLTGIVVDDRDGWALISLGGMPQIVKAGDVLEGGEIVNRIDARGVWITWRDIPQLIPVNRADTSTMMRDLSAEAEAAPAPPSDGGEVDVVLERLDRHGLQETFESAGRLVMTEMADGMPGLDVVWIRQGELYDRIGLRTGDKILRVNGSLVETRDLLAHLPDAITNGGTMALEILRDGTRQIIKVNLGQG